MASSGLTLSVKMIISMLLFGILHNGLSAINGYEEVEQNVFTKLGSTQRPVVEKNTKIPQSSTMELYKSMVDKNNAMATHFSLPGVRTTTANTARIYSNKGTAPIKAKAKKYRLQFDIDSMPEPHQFKAAEVRFTMKYDQVLRNGESIQVILHDIIQPGEKGISKPVLRIIDSKSINMSTISMTESFDVTPFIERLSKTKFEENHGILVQCVTESGSHTHLLSVFDFVSPENTLLLVYTDDGTSEKSSTLERMLQRSKRTANAPAKPRKRAKSSACKRHSMYVNFKEIGFSDWIEAPPGYEAFYCHGECTFPLADHMNASNHAAMQMRINAYNLAKVPRACCVPTKLSMQTLLYRDDDGILVMKNYPNMTVEECGCR